MCKSKVAASINTKEFYQLGPTTRRNWESNLIFFIILIRNQLLSVIAQKSRSLHV